ncbi:putative protein phosphatase 2C 37 [Panicum miliaceum]|uniref:protein-serine/threonine phosphatase n=1 Tax=Panicum miliaceum TaxID=4540 RepID=A0A3L6PXU9_PANMI|nr:putative protein phosphatase 2C 37 [Panicum miliaceum]
MVMASAGVNMPGGDGNVPAAASSPSTPGCRIRSRRRRLAPPPVAAAAAGSSEGAGDAAGPSREKRVRPASPTSSSSPSDVDSRSGEDAEAEELQQPPLPPAVPQLPAAAAQAWPPVAFGSLSVAGRSRDMEDTVSLRPGFHTWVDGSPMHFFGVFDGHGGSHEKAEADGFIH